MSGMNSKNCCKSCPGDTEICCLKGTFVGGAFDGQELFFVKRSYGSGAGSTPSVWEFGETCSETDGSGKCNNMTGYLRTGWNTYTDIEETNPFLAFKGCMPDIHVKWMPDTADCKVKMFLGGNGGGGGRLFIAQGWNCEAHVGEWPYDMTNGHIWTLGYSAYNLNSNWHTGTVTLTDWRYMKLHDLHPDDYPLPAPTFTLEACPVRDNFEPVDNGNIRFFFKWQYRDLDDVTGEAEGDWLDTGVCGVIEGDCMCLTSAVSTGYYGGGGTYFGFNWPDRVKIGASNALGFCTFCFPADLSCSWYDDLPEYLECPNEYIYYDPEAIADPFKRIVFTKLGAEEAAPACSEEEEPPTGEEEYCFRQSLCLQLAFNKDIETGDYESEVQCYILWDEDLDRYHIAACDSAENDCSTLVEIHEIVPTETCSSDEGYREWEVTILITSISTAFELYSDTFRVCLKCGSHWSIMQHIELEDTTTIDLRIGTTCTTVPTLPPCDPLCWPECVLCPTPLAMSLVVTQDPSCCLHGSYGLTYNSGSNWFTLTSAPVGGPSGVCGKITAFKMTCSDSTHVTLAITYEDVNGSTINSTTTVAASCSGGGFETASVTVTSGLFAPGLCEGGIGLGAKFRVVGI